MRVLLFLTLGLTACSMPDRRGYISTPTEVRQGKILDCATGFVDRGVSLTESRFECDKIYEGYKYNSGGQK